MWDISIAQPLPPVPLNEIKSLIGIPRLRKHDESPCMHSQFELSSELKSYFVTQENVVPYYEAYNVLAHMLEDSQHKVGSIVNEYI